MGNCSQVNNTTIKGTSAVTYDSTPLPCTDVNTCDGLNTILKKFDDIICSVKANVDIITEDVVNLTEDVMVITENITNINNQLNICCPTTTTTTTIAPTTTTVIECMEYVASGEFGGGTVNYNDCFGNPQSFTVAFGEFSDPFCALEGSVFASGFLQIDIIGPCGV